MRRNITVLLLVALLGASFVSLALADEIERPPEIPSPYSEYGAETYSCLNIFKAAFPDTKPGEEEYYFDINWGASPERGYLSLPLTLPGYGAYTSAKLNAFMSAIGVPVKDNQYKLYDVQYEPLPCVYRRGLRGQGNWKLIPPVDDYVVVMASTPWEEIRGLAEAGIWQVNLRRGYPDVGQDVPPGWLSCYYFYPPDLQVKDLKPGTKRPDGKAVAQATFYNAYVFGGLTDVHLYLVKKDGTRELLKEQEVYIGPWGTATLSAEYAVTPDVAAIAASVARPWTGTEWGYGKFVTSEKIDGKPLLDLAGHAVEMGSGAYPPEMLDVMRDRWDNNVREVPAGGPVNLKVENFAFSTDPAVPGETVTVYAEVVNESYQDVATKVRCAFNNRTVTEPEIRIPARDRKEISFNVTAPSPGSYAASVLANPDRDAPPDETTYDDNRAGGTLRVAAPPPPGSGELTFRAVSQNRKITRPPGEAKWTDWVTATLKPSPPTPPKGALKSWSITSAKLTYPKKHPEFTFGHPLPPQGTVTVNMTPRGHTATVEFKEDWSLNGAPIYDVIEGSLIPGPTYYTITAQYTVRFTYEWKERRRSCSTGADGKRSCDTYYVTKTATGTTSGTATGKLLVNGTGVTSQAM